MEVCNYVEEILQEAMDDSDALSDCGIELPSNERLSSSTSTITMGGNLSSSSDEQHASLLQKSFVMNKKPRRKR